MNHLVDKQQIINIERKKDKRENHSSYERILKKGKEKANILFYLIKLIAIIN